MKLRTAKKVFKNHVKDWVQAGKPAGSFFGRRYRTGTVRLATRLIPDSLYSQVVMKASAS